MTLLSDAATASDYPEAKAYIQLTRGVAPRDHVPTDPNPSTAVITIRRFTPAEPTLYEHGVPTITVDDLRWGRCDIKCVCLISNVLAKQEARKAQAFEALFVRDGHVLEGATSNVMTVKDGTIFTAPESPLILSGVTRQLVLDLAREAGIPVKQQASKEAECQRADEMFLTGTTIEILPVSSMNGHPIGKGSPWPVTKVLME